MVKQNEHLQHVAKIPLSIIFSTFSDENVNVTVSK